jgi:hypothetical protein
MKKLFALMLISGIVHKASAQTNLPNIIPPSPEVAQLFRYQDYPVDYSTGLAQVEIPLYNIKSSELEVPISLSYHAHKKIAAGVANGRFNLDWFKSSVMSKGDYPVLVGRDEQLTTNT